MTLWLVCPPVSAKMNGHIERRNISKEPCRTIHAGGVGGLSTYWIEEDGQVPKLQDEDGKPPYKVPSMAEIAAIPWNGLTVVSTFSGCGGSSLGYRMAGFRVLLASEFIEAARDSYRANMRPGTYLDDRDIREVTPESILKILGMKVGDLDLLDGSPPCASFSTAGKRQKHWGEVKKYSDKVQRTDDLFFEFARLLRGLRPKSFVAENVSGLVKGTAKGYFLEILKELKSCGYRVACKVLDAQWLGVPQQRQRCIFVGVREDLRGEEGLPIQPAHPRPLPFRYSVREAIPWIAGTAHHKQFENYDGEREVKSGDDPCPTDRGTAGGSQHFKAVITNDKRAGGLIEKSSDEPAMTVRGTRSGSHGVKVEVGANGPFGEERWKDGSKEPAGTIGAGPSTGNGLAGGGDLKLTKIEPEADMRGYAVGEEASKLMPGQQSEKYFQLVRAPLDGSSPTVTAEGGTTSLASVCHPTEQRKFSIAELRRICAFPDDFVLTGSYSQQWERLGRAVPPLMMRAVAEVVRDFVLIPAIGRKVLSLTIRTANAKPLLVGQSPSALTDGREGRKAFSGNSGEKLAAILGVGLAKLLSSVEAVNLLDRFRGRSEGGKGDDFPLDEGRRAASLLALSGRKVILVGKGVAEAFELADMAFLEVREVRGAKVLLLPHPSGINSWWNKGGNIEAGRKALREMLGWK